jgi:hypothetical protein
MGAFASPQINFAYPDILRQPAGHVLERFAAGGATLALNQIQPFPEVDGLGRRPVGDREIGRRPGAGRAGLGRAGQRRRLPGPGRVAAVGGRVPVAIGEVDMNTRASSTGAIHMQRREEVEWPHRDDN